ncbi:hypothetical protein ABZ912_16320 [Nonomuraea angiospora]|uniref:hypothetical protein n=1 Tax=Nonomuraea angiospora TaxID=46172 RepID=UPI003401D7C8
MADIAIPVRKSSRGRPRPTGQLAGRGGDEKAIGERAVGQELGAGAEAKGAVPKVVRPRTEGDAALEQGEDIIL